MFEEERKLDTDKLINEVLKTEPEFFLSADFADGIAEKVGRKFAWQQYIREFLVYLAVIVGIAMASAAMAFFWFNADWKGWLDFLVSNAILVAGINLLLIFVLFTDRVLLRYFMFRSSPQTE